MQSPYEKRKKERVKTRVKVGVVPPPQDTGESKPLRTTGVDVSVSGLAFLCNREYAAGTELRVELPLPNTTISLSSIVVRSEPTEEPEQWKVAVRFEALSNECLRMLGWFVKEEGRKQLLDQGAQHPSSATSPAIRSAATSKPQPSAPPAARSTPTLVRDSSISIATSSKLEARRLRRGEEAFVSGFLKRQPLLNVVLLGAVSDYGLESAYHRGSFYGCFRQEQLVGVALIGRHVILSGSEESIPVFANVARLSHDLAPMMALGDAEMTEKFCHILTQPPSHLAVRLSQLQVLYTMTKSESGARTIQGLRQAGTDEREEVAQVHARITREDTGVDPLARDPIGFRKRILARIERGREWIWRDGQGIAFKTDVVFETEEGIYLEGVWVRPDLREDNLGSILLRSLSQRLLRHHRGVCMFADSDDQPTNTFYQKAGFEATAPFRVVRFCPRNEQ